ESGSESNRAVCNRVKQPRICSCRNPPSPRLCPPALAFKLFVLFESSVSPRPGDVTRVVAARERGQDRPFKLPLPRGDVPARHSLLFHCYPIGIGPSAEIRWSQHQPDG